MNGKGQQDNASLYFKPPLFFLSLLVFVIFMEEGGKKTLTKPS